MKFDTMVKFNGRYYLAGEEVPTGASSVPAEEPKVDVVEKTEKPKKTTKKAE